MRFSPLFEKFNEQIDRMISHGIINYLYRRFQDISRKNEDIGPQVMTIDHIGIGFVVVLIFLGMSLIVFIIEVVVHRLSNRRD
jgi:uncharacterized membrane protein